MAKILVTGAGSAQSNGVINCLLDTDNPEEIIGAGAEKTDLIFCRAKRKYLLPHSLQKNYKEKLLQLLELEKPDFINIQHDQELFVVSSFREDIVNIGTKLFIPDHEDIDNCVHKYKSYLKFKAAGIKVPKNIIINNVEDLRKSFLELRNNKKNKLIWLRQLSIGGGGKGAVATDNFNFAKEWITKNNGWGDFVAAEILTQDTATFLSIWYQGEIIVGQGRKRESWLGRSVSGVTGVTKVGQISSDHHIVDIAIQAIKAVSNKPHGIFGVDMAYDQDGFLNPTEINIGRFFTTVQFFKEAGLNMPEILKDIAIYNKFPTLKNKINPLQQDELLWLRAIDHSPMLITKQELEEQVIIL